MGITMKDFECHLEKVLTLSLRATLDLGNQHTSSLFDIANATFTNSSVGNVIIHEIGNMITSGGRLLKQTIDDERDYVFNRLTLICGIVAVAAVLALIIYVLIQKYACCMICKCVPQLSETCCSKKHTSDVINTRKMVITEDQKEEPLKVPAQFYTLPNGTVVDNCSL